MGEALKQQDPCQIGLHDWDSGKWGVIFGVSRCRLCDKLALKADFVSIDPPVEPPDRRTPPDAGQQGE